jgi:hypothetical protein
LNTLLEIQEGVMITGIATRRLPLRANNVAKRLGMKERNVRYLAETKKLIAFKIDRKSWGFWPEDVERYRSQRGCPDE